MGSPPPGSSSLMTSAPRSARSMEPYGPASMRERSRTRTPSKRGAWSGPPATSVLRGHVHHQRHERLVPDGHDVVEDSRRDVERVAGPQEERRVVVEEDPRLAGDDVGDVLAALVLVAAALGHADRGRGQLDAHVPSEVLADQDL